MQPTTDAVALSLPEPHAEDASFAADDEFLARRQNRSRRWRVILIVLLFAAIPVSMAIFVGPALLPESTGPLETALRDLVRLCREIESKAGDRPDRAKWTAYDNSTSPKLRNAIRPIAMSRHQAMKPLVNARTAMLKALRVQTQSDFDQNMQDARRKLTDAKQKLGL